MSRFATDCSKFVTAALAPGSKPQASASGSLEMKLRGSRSACSVIARSKAPSSATRTIPGRLTLIDGPRGCRLLDDTYNANPGAVKAALEALAKMPAPRWCFLGAMGELGDASASFHAQIGHYARELGIDFLGTLGAEAEPAAHAFGERGCHFMDWAALLRHAHDHLPSGASVLVKGSRSAGMERLITELRADVSR